MGKIKSFVINLIAKKYVLGIVAGLFSKIKGYKSQIGIGLIVILKFCLYMSFIPSEFIPIVNEVIIAIYGASAISIGDKARRYWESLSKATSEVIVNK